MWPNIGLAQTRGTWTNAQPQSPAASRGIQRVNMNRRKRIVRDYAKMIAEETNIPEKRVNTILMFAWRNIVRMMELKEDVRIVGLGRIIIDRPKTSKAQTHDKRRDERNDLQDQ